MVLVSVLFSSRDSPCRQNTSGATIIAFTQAVMYSGPWAIGTRASNPNELPEMSLLVFKTLLQQSNSMMKVGLLPPEYS